MKLCSYKNCTKICKRKYCDEHKVSKKKAIQRIIDNMEINFGKSPLLNFTEGEFNNFYNWCMSAELSNASKKFREKTDNIIAKLMFKMINENKNKDWKNEQEIVDFLGQCSDHYTPIREAAKGHIQSTKSNSGKCLEACVKFVLDRFLNNQQTEKIYINTLPFGKKAVKYFDLVNKKSKFIIQVKFNTRERVDYYEGDLESFEKFLLVYEDDLTLPKIDEAILKGYKIIFMFCKDYEKYKKQYYENIITLKDFIKFNNV